MHKIAQSCGIISKNKSDSLQFFKGTWGIINGFRVGLYISIINDEIINLSTRKYYLEIQYATTIDIYLSEKFERNGFRTIGYVWFKRDYRPSITYSPYMILLRRLDIDPQRSIVSSLTFGTNLKLLLDTYSLSRFVVFIEKMMWYCWPPL